jgi:hypothetical protein
VSPRDDCIDPAMRRAYLDALPHAQESRVEVVGTFESFRRSVQDSM